MKHKSYASKVKLATTFSVRFSVRVASDEFVPISPQPEAVKAVDWELIHRHPVHADFLFLSLHPSANSCCDWIGSQVC